MTTETSHSLACVLIASTIGALILLALVALGGCKKKADIMTLDEAIADPSRLNKVGATVVLPPIKIPIEEWEAMKRGER